MGTSLDPVVSPATANPRMQTPVQELRGYWFLTANSFTSQPPPFSGTCKGSASDPDMYPLGLVSLKPLEDEKSSERCWQERLVKSLVQCTFTQLCAFSMPLLCCRFQILGLYCSMIRILDSAQILANCPSTISSRLSHVKNGYSWHPVN